MNKESNSATTTTERKRSRFDEVGELGRDTRESRETSERSEKRNYHRDDDKYERYDREERSRREHEHRHRDERGSEAKRHRSENDSHYKRDRERERERYRERSDFEEREHGRERGDYERNRDSESSSRYDRDSRYERDGRYESNSRYDRDNNYRRYDRRQSGNSVEIPFDRFLRLSPWRGPVTPLEERPRHLKNWDAAPAGFERISAEKAKLTGLFPPPGNIAKSGNYVPPTLDPARAAMFQLLNRENVAVSAASATVVPSADLSGNLLKQAKRFYVGNLPFNFTESRLTSFLESNLQGLSGGQGNVKDEGGKVLSLAVSSDRSYAFVECRTAEDASLAMNLDGVVFEGVQLKVRRPKEYHLALTSSGNTQGTSQTYSSSSSVLPVQQDNSLRNKRQLIISGIPDILSPEHVKSLLLLVADLRTFLLLRDREAEKSLGVAVFEFVEDVEGEEWSGPFLKHSNGGSIFMGPFEMKVQRICDVMDDEEGDFLRNLLSVYNLQPGYATAPSSTPVLQLLNIVNRDSLLLDYDSIYQDLQQELLKYSSTDSIDLFIPNPKDPSESVPGVGKVFVKFGKIEDAAKAAGELAGRIFDGHTCIVSFYPPEKFDKRLF